MAFKKVLAVHGDFEQKLPKVKWSQLPWTLYINAGPLCQPDHFELDTFSSSL